MMTVGTISGFAQETVSHDNWRQTSFLIIQHADLSIRLLVDEDCTTVSIDCHRNLHI